MKTLNILNKNITRNVEVVAEIREVDFWKWYLHFLNINANNKALTNQEIDLLAVILAKDVFKSYFKSPQSDEILEELGIGYTHLHNLKVRLIDKGLVVRGSEAVNDYILSENLSKIQRIIKKGLLIDNEIGFTFPFKITLTDEQIKSYKDIPE